MTRPGIELGSPGPLANTLPTRPIISKAVKLATLVEGDPEDSLFNSYYTKV